MILNVILRKLRQACYILAAMLAARTVQDFLLGTADIRSQPWEVWIQVMEKRIVKMRAIDKGGKMWKVEARKRLLQIAAVAIAMIEWVDAGVKE